MVAAFGASCAACNKSNTDGGAAPSIANTAITLTPGTYLPSIIDCPAETHEYITSLEFTDDTYIVTVKHFRDFPCNTLEYTLVSTGTYTATTTSISFKQESLVMATAPGQSAEIAANCLSQAFVDNVPVDVDGVSCYGNVFNLNHMVHQAPADKISDTQIDLNSTENISVGLGNLSPEEYLGIPFIRQ